MQKMADHVMSSSLFLLCLHRLAQLLDVYVTSVKRLPPTLKDVIRSTATAAGFLNSRNLPCVLHCNVCELDLSRCDLDQKSLEALKTCTNIMKLDLSSFADVARNFNALTLASLFPSLPQLTTLNLNYVAAVTDEVTEAIVANCPSMTALYLQGCQEVTDTSLETLPALEHLQVLNISSTKVKDVGMVHMLDECGERLRKLYIANCPNLTRTTFVAVVRNWVSLERLVCDGCPFEGDNLSEIDEATILDRQLHREIELREREAQMHNMMEDAAA